MKVKGKNKKGQQERIKTGFLPMAIREAFGKKILPPLLCWVAAQAHPWKPDTKDLIKALEMIGRLYTGDEYKVEDGKKSPEYCFVSTCPLSLLLSEVIYADINIGNPALQ